jgi:hypothetical protein
MSFKITIQMLAPLIALLALAPCCRAAEKIFTDEDRAWWAIQPVTDPAVPADRHPIDAFIDQKLSAAKLQRAPAASPEEFIRRATFDLHGLPPSPDAVTKFIADWQINTDTAVESLIDELLASPRYGERWAQHWLDVVRYAESDGYREDAFRDNTYRYRDYVIRAFNHDKPYDQFIREQLAADEFAADDPLTIEATGFLRLGIYEWNQRNAEMQRELMVNEITNITSEVFLGLGLGCARCHDHKFDPLLQRDYFALQAFLSSTAWPTDSKLGTPDELEALANWEQETAPLREEMDSILAERRNKVGEAHVRTFPDNVQAMYWKPQSERTSYEQQISMLVQRQVDRERNSISADKELAKSPEKLARYKELEQLLTDAESRMPALQTAFVSTDTGTTPAVTLMKNEPIDPAYPKLLGQAAPDISANEHTTGRRTALANWIASADNPFTARVYTNRLWHYHFGKGLVATPNDFGTLGEPPTHPELLDWLTSRFVEGGWKTKPMHRLIMTSQTYRQTARREPGETENIADADNKLLWRFPPTRLSAEQTRDAMLAVSGTMTHRENGGPSQNSDAPLRSIYVKKMRNTPDPFLQSFDSPSGFDSTPDRQKTTTPTQALLLSNNDWPIARARDFAKRILKSHDPVFDAYYIAWGRLPTADEIQIGRQFVDELKKSPKPTPAIADKFPNENGFRPIEQNFSAFSKVDLNPQSLWLQPGSRFEKLHLANTPLSNDAFNIEGIVQLDSIQKDASVNTLISRWSGDTVQRGWALGVTSEKSRYKPRNLIMQLVGSNPGGDTEYQVVASDLIVPTGKPFHFKVSIESQKITFTLDDQTVVVTNNIVGAWQYNESKILVGGRDEKSAKHLWDGQIGKLVINGQKIDFTQAAWLKKEFPVIKTDPTLDALTDFCHALLSSNEFLYLH